MCAAINRVCPGGRSSAWGCACARHLSVTGRGASPGFAVPVPALLLVGCARCHALVLADGVGQRRPDLFRELQFFLDVCDLIEKARKECEATPQALLVPP